MPKKVLHNQLQMPGTKDNLNLQFWAGKREKKKTNRKG